jgi:hypothetical protein
MTASRDGLSPQDDYGGSTERFCGHHAVVGSRNSRSAGAAATVIISVHEAQRALVRNRAQRMLDLVISDEPASIPGFPCRGVEEAASLEICDGKSVVLLSQDIPESAGHVHKAFSLKVRRAVYY